MRRDDRSITLGIEVMNYRMVFEMDSAMDEGGKEGTSRMMRMEQYKLSIQV